MIKHAAFSLHGNILRYRGEDVAVIHDPNVTPVDAFLRALHGIPDADIDALEQDIADLQQELDYLHLEIAKALKFHAIGEHMEVQAILQRIVTDDEAD